MGKNKQPSYAAMLSKLAVGQSESYDREQRAALSEEIKRINNERNAYEFEQSKTKNGTFNVTRVTPSNPFDRRMYISSISKTQLTNVLRDNNWSREGAARTLGISARTIGRMEVSLNVKTKPYLSNGTSSANKTANSSAAAKPATAKPATAKPAASRTKSASSASKRSNVIANKGKSSNKARTSASKTTKASSSKAKSSKKGR